MIRFRGGDCIRYPGYFEQLMQTCHIEYLLIQWVDTDKCQHGSFGYLVAVSLTHIHTQRPLPEINFYIFKNVRKSVF